MGRVRRLVACTAILGAVTGVPACSESAGSAHPADKWCAGNRHTVPVEAEALAFFDIDPSKVIEQVKCRGDSGGIAVIRFADSATQEKYTGFMEGFGATIQEQGADYVVVSE